MLYVEEIKKQREELEENADAELLRREREMERISRYQYKERQRRLKLYMEYHREFKGLIIPYNVPQDPKGVLYRELKQTYEENVTCIDEIDVGPIFGTEYLLMSTSISFMVLMAMMAIFICSGNTLMNPPARVAAILIILFVAAGLWICPILAKILTVRHRIKLAAECEVTCHILETRNPTIRFQDA